MRQSSLKKKKNPENELNEFQNRVTTFRSVLPNNKKDQ